jgi:hypothetical protein
MFMVFHRYIAACDKCGADRMPKTGRNGAGALVVVARVLVKEGGDTA